MKWGFPITAAMLLLAPLAAAQQAKLVNDKKLSLGSDGTASSLVTAACVSPDGKYLLYAKCEKTAKRPEGYSGRWSGRLYRPMLRNLATGKDKKLPVPAWTWDDPLKIMFAMNVFDHAGKKIALGFGVSGIFGDTFDDRNGTMNPGLYDIAADKLHYLPVEKNIVFPSFDRTGTKLIITAFSKGRPPKELTLTPAEKYEPEKIAVAGIPFPTCPAADILPMMLRHPGFSLYDFKAGKTVAELPLKGGNKLDDYPPRWSADGRYLAYYDETASTSAHSWSPKFFTRFWDRKAGKQAATVEGAVPVGPGPGEATMVLETKGGKSILLYDIAAGKQTALVSSGGTGRIQCLYAGGGRILYAKVSFSGKAEYHLAKIQLPKKDKQASTKPRQ